MSDEEIQNRIQQGEHLHGVEGQAYRHVFEALQKEPGFVLPPSFADKVIHRITTTPEQSYDMVWMIAGFSGCLIALMVVVLLTGFKVNLGVLNFVKEYTGLLLFGAAFLLALQWVDRRVVRKLMA